MSEPPRDAGLQLERTLLAWRRTALALVVAGLLLVRLAIPDALPAAPLGLGCVVLGTAASVAGARRYRRRHEAGQGLPPGGGRLVTITAIGVAAAGIGSAAWVAALR